MEPIKDFGGIATGLARGPLGIIALFIVLVYGFASVVAAVGNEWTLAERLPLVYFMVLFPVVVLGVFAWLVSRHHTKLYPPTDFKDEKNFIEVQRMQMSAAASLAVATAKTEGGLSAEPNIHKVVAAVERASNAARVRTNRVRTVLWVDDRPTNNTYTQKAFEEVGVPVTLALSTDDALAQLRHKRFSVIISDMGRKEGPQEGYVLLDKLREIGDDTPFFIHAGSSLSEHKRETERRGGQGCTSNPSELFEWVMDVLDK